MRSQLGARAPGAVLQKRNLRGGGCGLLPRHGTHSRRAAAAARWSARGPAVAQRRGRLVRVIADVTDVGAAEEDLSMPDLGDGIDWFYQWYPVAFVSDLDKSHPHRFVLLDIPLVIWWDPNAAAWRVFEDMCPHRLVPLSEGRINKAGLLECGYHGWAFSSQGRCEVVPQQGNKDTPRACATAYPCAVRQGLLFVLPRPLPPALLPGGAANGDMGEALAAAAADEARIPVIAELDTNEGWVAQDVWRDLPYDYATLLENVLDSSHVPFTHHVTVSNRNVLGPYDIKITEPLTEAGFKGLWKTGPRAGKLGPQSTSFVAPAFMRHRLDGDAFSSITAVYAVPMRPGRCRLINRNIFRFKAGGPSALFKLLPPWWGHVSSHLLLEDDQIFLHLGEEELARRRASGLAHSQVCYMPSRADTFVVAFNRWLSQYGGGGPFGPVEAGLVEALGERLPRKALLDRYTQHTEQCATCQKGLTQVTAARSAAQAVAAAAGALAVLCAAVAVAGAAAPPPAGVEAVAAGGPAQGGGGGGGALAAVGSALLQLGLAVTGAGDPSGVMLHGLAWAALAAAAAFAGSRLEALRMLFYEGVYPPPRNVKD